MKPIKSNIVFTLLYIVFSLNFILAYTQVFNLFLLSVPIGILSIIVFPLVTWYLFRLALLWVNKDQILPDESIYKSRKSYIRIWMLSFEWMLFFIALLVLNGLFILPWMRTALWLLSGVLSLFWYPKYLKKVTDEAIINDPIREKVFLNFKVVSTLVAGFGFIFGLAAIVLTGVGWIAQLFLK